MAQIYISGYVNLGEWHVNGCLSVDDLDKNGGPLPLSHQRNMAMFHATLI